MRKRPSSQFDAIQKIRQTPPPTYKTKRNDHLIEAAAEQFADLLLKCWLASNNAKVGKKTKIKQSHQQHEKFLSSYKTS